MPVPIDALYARGLVSDDALQRIADVRNQPGFPPHIGPDVGMGGSTMGGASGARRIAPDYSPERIKSAAVRVGGKVYEGAIHSDAFDKAWEDAQSSGRPLSLKDMEDGFVTTNGKFVSRGDAATIAKSQRQTLSTTDELHTGNLTPEE